MSSKLLPVERLILPSSLAIFLCLIFPFTPRTASANQPEASEKKMFLHEGWALQSSCLFLAMGEQISAPGFKTNGWHSATVPTTVVAALVADKTYPDPYYGKNLRDIPGATYPISKNFSLLPMPRESPFRCPWWYRTEFTLPASYSGRHVWLHFGGINNHANIWLNGQLLAGVKEIAGAYRTYDFDISLIVNRSGPNALAVETIAQTEKDLGINWVDWNPAPPDKDMGLWRSVYLQSSEAVAIRHPMVVTHFPAAALDEAELTVETELRNASGKQVTGFLDGRFDDVKFRQTLVLKPRETRTVRFTPAEFPQLRIKNPKVWWPYRMGAQDLHELSLRFIIGDDSSDEQTVRFGIREITSELNAQGARQFYVNGKKILIRGGGWSPDMLFRTDRARLETDFRYIRELNLNAVRLEGKMETDEFYDLADEQGVLIMAGWCCCDHWELWKHWQPGDLEIASASLRSQILRMRSHPSMLVWLNGSDMPPPADVETEYIKVLKETDWPNPYISSASATPTSLTGQSGVKMTGPYDYVPPNYWLIDINKYGGAFGFNTETGPGPAVPLVSCLRKFIPAEHLWPEDSFWNYHAGSEGFRDLSHFDGAMKSIYGPPAGLEDYEIKSQAMAYDGERAMFEAYSRNKYTSTGVIQWMLNNAWPSLIWHLYDYYQQPAGGYFGTKKACEPLHVQYSYDDNSIVVVNSLYQNFTGLTVTARVYDDSLHERFSKQVQADVDADGVTRALTLPAEAFSPASPVYFVKLELQTSDGKIASTNFYWLSPKKNVYEWGKTTYKYTPVSSYEDLTALQTLPKVKLEVAETRETAADGSAVRVTVKNPSDHLAFQVRFGIQKIDQHAEILPIFWDDNYIELMPGESREITARYLPTAEVSGPLELTIAGWNVVATAIPLKEDGASSPQTSGGGR
ncbi:MAG TPA: glycoside hydrolase family 2 TIM barrel-domain containing protein [Candidatus Acidoferrales bacterium]|nr:glycoside hydrolase family 2 TIM barrel-domain containing protein [Candidatus Acidoferrales bacterium]